MPKIAAEQSGSCRCVPSARRFVATRAFLAAMMASAIGACASSTPAERDGGDGDAGVRDAASGGPDAGECASSDVAGWSCVQGDRGTHACTDSMYPPTCVDGRWQCSGEGEPDWYVDCWCHVGPWPWPEHVDLCACTEADGWVCDFHCG